MSEIYNKICFPFYLEKVENGSKFVESKTVFIGRDFGELGFPWKIVHGTVSDIWHSEFFLGIFKLHKLYIW